jgi:hypothetical protein
MTGLNEVPTQQTMQRMIETCLMSRYIKRAPNEPPLSLMLVAPPSAGKSMVLKRYADNKNVKWASDLTSYGIFQRLLSKGELQTVIIPDFMKMVIKRQDTANNLESALLVAVEDGYKGESTYKTAYKPYKHPHRLQVLTGMTSVYFGHKKHWYEDIGLLDRFLVANVPLTWQEEAKIRKMQDDGIAPDTSPVKLDFPKDSPDILLPPKISGLIPMCSPRQRRNLRLYLKASAFLKGFTKVTSLPLELRCFEVEKLVQY